KAGIGFTALDNGFAAASDPAAVQAICDTLTEDKIDALLRKWLAPLPHPFTAAGRAAGYREEPSVLQAEFSLTQMPGAPVSGRICFEQVIRDNLDLGRPDRVSLVFARQIQRGRKRPTPGVFRTRVITQHVTPSLHVDYKHTTVKQYHKEGQALRTETTINDTYDFEIGRRLTNLPALAQIGFAVNRRLLSVERPSRTRPHADPPPPPPPRRPRRPARQPQPGHPRHRPARRRHAPHLPADPGPAIGHVRLPPAAPRLHQPRPAPPPGTPARHHRRGHDQRATQLPPPPAALPRVHPAHPAHPPLPGYQRRAPA